ILQLRPPAWTSHSNPSRSESVWDHGRFAQSLPQKKLFAQARSFFVFGSEIAHVETVALGCLVERSSARQPLHYARQLSMEYKLPARAVEPQSLRMMMEIQQQHVSYKTHHK